MLECTWRSSCGLTDNSSHSAFTTTSLLPSFYWWCHVMQCFWNSILCICCGRGGGSSVQCVVLWIVGGDLSVQVLLHFCHLTPHQGDSWTCSVHCRSYTYKTRSTLRCIEQYKNRIAGILVHCIVGRAAFSVQHFSAFRFLRHEKEKGLFPTVLKSKSANSPK